MAQHGLKNRQPIHNKLFMPDLAAPSISFVCSRRRKIFELEPGIGAMPSSPAAVSTIELALATSKTTGPASHS